MKKIIVSLISLALINLQCYSFDGIINSVLIDNTINDIIEYDDSEIYEEFESINWLVNDLNAYPDLGVIQTASRAVVINQGSVSNLNNNEKDLSNLGMGGFWWGFIFAFPAGCSFVLFSVFSFIIAPAGILVVYLLDKDNTKELKNSIWGCATGAAAGTILSVALVVALYSTILLSSSGTTYDYSYTY